MDLKDFVASTLISIIDGVREAQTRYRGDRMVLINPQLLMDSNTDKASPFAKFSGLNRDNLQGSGLLATSTDMGFADIVEFDVALTVSEDAMEGGETDKKAGGGLKVYVASAEANVQTKNTNETKNSRSNVSRIKFRIPVQFPRSA